MADRRERPHQMDREPDEYRSRRPDWTAAPAPHPAAEPAEQSPPPRQPTEPAEDSSSE